MTPRGFSLQVIILLLVSMPASAAGPPTPAASVARAAADAIAASAAADPTAGSPVAPAAKPPAAPVAKSAAAIAAALDAEAADTSAAPPPEPAPAPDNHYTTSLRLGTHDTYGRVVFLVPHGVNGRLTAQDGDKLRVTLPGAGDVASASRGVRNVTAIGGAEDGAVLTLTPGSRPVLWQNDGRVVVDVYDAAVRPPGGMAPSAAVAPPPPAARAAAPATVRRGPPADAARATLPPADAARATVPPADAARATVPAKQEPAHAASPPDLQVVRLAAVPPLTTTPDAAAIPAPAKPTPVVAAPLPTPEIASAPPATPPLATDNVATDGLVAARVPPETIAGGDAILVPFARDVGAAAFARGGLAHVVFDDAKPVDLAQLKGDPVFGDARVTLLPAATHLALHLAPGSGLSLKRRPEGWQVAVVKLVRAMDAAPIRMQNGVLDVGAPMPADTVVMDDPATGGRLLVGTVLGEGPAVAVSHQSPDFALLPSWAGVLVAAQSDRLALRAAKNSFSLATATGPPLAAVVAAETEQALASAGTLTRRFDLSAMPVAARRQRLTTELAAIATAPKLGRFRPRLRAAQDMVALGLDREAAATIRMAVADDPVHEADPDAAALHAMADWMAGRGDGAALAAPSLGDSDEVSLWRAVLRPGTASHAAATLAGTWRLLLAYPAPLQHRLLPLVADILLKGGQPAAAAALLAKIDDPSLDLARVAALKASGKTDLALALLDKLSTGRDRKQAAAAQRDAVELRLAAGALTPGAAAALLDQHLYAWRDDALEADERLRIAALRSRAGDWRRALALLRETETTNPDTHDRVRAVERQVIADLLASSAASRLAPLDLVALVEENADLLAEKGASETLAPVLVDKLLALDLPDRADPILSKLVTATQSPEAKAALGARLAALRLEQGDAAGAKTALSDTDVEGLPPALESHRTVLQARGLVLDAKDDAALKLLDGLGSPEALEMQAGLREKRHDWHGAETALQKLAASTLPSQGALSDAQQDLVLRLASAASEAGDWALISRLQAGDATRLAGGPRSQLFQALATKPVQAVADLARSGREAEAARAVPAALASYDAH